MADQYSRGTMVATDHDMRQEQPGGGHPRRSSFRREPARRLAELGLRIALWVAVSGNLDVGGQRRGRTVPRGKPGQ